VQIPDGGNERPCETAEGTIDRARRRPREQGTSERRWSVGRVEDLGFAVRRALPNRIGVAAVCPCGWGGKWPLDRTVDG
jgi:hypothetical protein